MIRLKFYCDAYYLYNFSEYKNSNISKHLHELYKIIIMFSA